MRNSISLFCFFCILLTSCRIEPPLHLPEDVPGGEITLPVVLTELDVIWDVDANWRNEWYYGWDETDEQLWGKLEYPLPTNYEVRRFYFGNEPGGEFTGHDGFTIYTNKFRRRFEFGYHNMLIWSNIDSPDGTQTVIINENDLSNIYATTSKSRLGYTTNAHRTRAVDTHNQPEIFYSTHVRDLYISPNIEDYDYFDEKEQVWVKCIYPELTPVVYIYLVQVILHNNNGRIIGVADQSSINGLADGVSLHTGETSQQDANITFDMRIKNDINCNNEVCDVIGGKLTTYGMCGMQPWKSKSRGDEVTRFDLENSLSLCLFYRNGKEIVLSHNLTEQIRKKPHGGVLTVHINVDDLGIQETPANSGFDPTAEDYGHKEYEFDI